METVQSYKCPCCGASLIFQNESLHCDSCGNDFELDAMRQIEDVGSQMQGESKYDWEHYEPRNYETDGEIELASYTCPSCGAEITGDDTMGSTICPYCGDAAVIKGQFEGTLRPDYIIPFKTEKKAAMEAFEADFKNAPFLPDEFKVKKKIEEMTGVYVPFWMFDCDCNAAITYGAQRVTSWSDSNYNYTKTDYYRLFRSGSVGFANIPVDGSKKADDAYMEAVEPFCYDDAVEFNGAYLSGYMADKYDVSVEECAGRADERCESTFEAALEDTVTGYDTCIAERKNIYLHRGKVHYALLPVWLLNTKWNGKDFLFAMNGQTGKMVGDLPMCWKKFWTTFAAIAAPLTILLTLFLM